MNKQKARRAQKASNSRHELRCPHAYRGMENGWADICWKIPISPPALKKKDVFILLCVCMPGALQRSEGGKGSPGTGVMRGGYEPPDARN